MVFSNEKTNVLEQFAIFTSAHHHQPLCVAFKDISLNGECTQSAYIIGEYVFRFLYSVFNFGLTS